MKNITVTIICFVCLVAGCSQTHITSETPRLADLAPQMSAADKYVYGESDQTKREYIHAALNQGIMRLAEKIEAIKKEQAETKRIGEKKLDITANLREKPIHFHCPNCMGYANDYQTLKVHNCWSTTIKDVNDKAVPELRGGFGWTDERRIKAMNRRR